MEVPRMLRPLGLMEIIDQTFRLYRTNFWLFFGIAAVAYIPAAVIQTIIQSLATYESMESTAMLVIMILSLLALIPVYFAIFLSTGAVTKAISDRYLGDRITIGDSYNFIFKRFWPYLATAILTGLFILSGLVLCLVGAVVFGFWAAFVTQIVVIEDKRYFDAVWRSKFLIGQGVWAQVFVLSLIMTILVVLLQLPFEAIAQLPVILGNEPNTVLTIIGTFLSGVVSALALPLGQIATTMLYYDSRIRKEGFDLQVLAQEMGKALPSTTVQPPQAPPQPPVITDMLHPPTPPESSPPTDETNKE